MASASKTVQMNVPIDKIWEVITNYQNYPNFVENIHRVREISKDSNQNISVYEYFIEIMGKEISYTIEHHENPKTKMQWKLVDSNFLKSNEGFWELVEMPNGTTQVTYSVSIDFKIPVPSLILNGIVKSTLPKMLESFENEAKKYERK
jgi:ribosome-associated toxin RatA of RatAB toxin-antitoxin module